MFGIDDIIGAVAGLFGGKHKSGGEKLVNEGTGYERQLIQYLQQLMAQSQAYEPAYEGILSDLAQGADYNLGWDQLMPQAAPQANVGAVGGKPIVPAIQNPIFNALGANQPRHAAGAAPAPPSPGMPLHVPRLSKIPTLNGMPQWDPVSTNKMAANLGGFNAQRAAGLARIKAQQGGGVYQKGLSESMLDNQYAQNVQGMTRGLFDEQAGRQDQKFQQLLSILGGQRNQGMNAVQGIAGIAGSLKGTGQMQNQYDQYGNQQQEDQLAALFANLFGGGKKKKVPLQSGSLPKTQPLTPSSGDDDAFWEGFWG